MKHQRYHYIFMLFVLSILVIISFFLIKTEVMAKPKAQYTPPNYIQVTMFALDPTSGAINPSLTDAECRNNNPETAEAFGCGDIADPYPNSTNVLTVNLEDEYLPYVMATEMTDGPAEAHKAQAVASRSYALHLIDVERTTLLNTSQHQVFVRRSPKFKPEHTQAVNATRGIILACSDNCWSGRYGKPIFAEFSPAHPLAYTNPASNLSQHPYLATVYDPIHNGVGHGRGMSQNGAFGWANGLSSGNAYYPVWDFRRILAHYFTEVLFQNMPPTILARNDYRSNVIQIYNLPDGYTFYNTSPVKDDIAVVLQNSGLLDWKLGKVGENSCRPDKIGGQYVYNLALSYHIYKLDNSGPACPSCFEGERTLLCLPPAHTNFNLPPGHPPFLVEDVKVMMPFDLPYGCYRLRWDIELLRNHQFTTWISWLHQTPEAQWPTQDMTICYQEQGNPVDPDPPRNPGSSSHEANTWDSRSSNPNITVTWDPPNGPVSGYEYRYEGAGSSLSSGWHSTGQTHASFSVTQDGNDHRLRIRSVLGSSESSSITAGPYFIDRRPPSVQFTSPSAPWVTTNNITLSWIGSDTGVSGQVSGLEHYDVYFATNPYGPWSLLAQATTNQSISVTGSDDQYYYFRVVASDRAGNSTEIRKTVQVRTFPYLEVQPNTIEWTQTLSNTDPHIVPLQILNDGGKLMTWTIETDFPYLILPQPGGVDDATFPITLTHPLTYGIFTGVFTVTGTTDTRQNPATRTVTIEIVDQFDYYLPIIFKN